MTPNTPKASPALSGDQWIELAERHANADWNCTKLDGYLSAVKALCADFAALSPAQAEPLGQAGAPKLPLANFNIALNTMHPLCHEAADLFWAYWRENGETHKRGYYESTWGAINQALRTVGIREHQWGDVFGNGKTMYPPAPTQEHK